MSREPYSQKSGWVNHSNERIIQAMSFKKVFTQLYYLVLMVDIAQSLIGDWKGIVVADLIGVRSPPPPPPPPPHY